MQRILVIRGGAIGDFVLTLPAIKLLRDAFPHAHLEILGYEHIIALADRRFYADATRSIEYAALSGFFARGAELRDDVADYFARFDLVVSYLFDPDRIFQGNLQRSGVKTILTCPPKITGQEHAAQQLARPLRELGLTLVSPAAQVYPDDDDRRAAATLLGDETSDFIALHPGSGGSDKNWSIANWHRLAERLLVDRSEMHLIIVAGEADEHALQAMALLRSEPRVRFVVSQPLPTVAAVLAGASLFVGHDSGVSHIAGAVGAKSLVVFGPTDPRVWAPANDNVHVLQATGGVLGAIGVDEVQRAAVALLNAD